MTALRFQKGGRHHTSPASAWSWGGGGGEGGRENKTKKGGGGGQVQDQAYYQLLIFNVELIPCGREILVPLPGKHSSRFKSGSTHSYQCVQYFCVLATVCCQRLAFLMRALMLTCATARWCCTNILSICICFTHRQQSSLCLRSAGQKGVCCCRRSVPRWTLWGSPGMYTQLHTDRRISQDARIVGV